jgi:hypothetical protein
LRRLTKGLVQNRPPPRIVPRYLLPLKRTRAWSRRIKRKPRSIKSASRSKPSAGRSPIGADPLLEPGLLRGPSAADKINAKAPRIKMISMMATRAPLRENPRRSTVAFGGTAVACMAITSLGSSFLTSRNLYSAVQIPLLEPVDLLRSLYSHGEKCRPGLVC